MLVPTLCTLIIGFLGPVATQVGAEQPHAAPDTSGNGVLEVRMRNEWPGGFSAMIQFVPDEHITGGWTITLVFPTPVASIEIWTAVVASVSEDLMVYELKNTKWNANLPAGQVLTMAFNGVIPPGGQAPKSVDAYLGTPPSPPTTESPQEGLSLDVINPDNWPSLQQVPSDVLDKAAFVVIGGVRGTNVIVHTRDSRTYLYSGDEGSGEREELRGITMSDAKMSKTVFNDDMFFLLLTVGGDVYQGTSEFKLVPGLANVTQIDVGARHCLALTQDKQVYFWGDIYSGGSAATPTLIDFKRAGFVPAQVASGWDHCMVLSQDGRMLMGWGYNAVSQLGLGQASPRWVRYENPLATPIPDGVQFQTIYCGDYSGFALDVNGQLWQWGDDYNGALGQGNRGPDQPAPTMNMPIMKYVTVASLKFWRFASVAITTENEVYVWGHYKGGVKGYATLVEDAADTPLDVFSNAHFPSTAGAVKLLNTKTAVLSRW